MKIQITIELSDTDDAKRMHKLWTARNVSSKIRNAIESSAECDNGPGATQSYFQVERMQVHSNEGFGERCGLCIERVSFE